MTLNLAGIQQHSQNEWTDYAMALDRLEPVTITWNADENYYYTTQYGGKIESRQRGRSHSTNGAGRRCMHALDAPRSCALFSRAWVTQLGWQPIIYTHCIASRHVDLVTIAFDVVGTTQYCRRKPGALEARNKFCYKLFPMRFDDDEHVSRSLWLGVCAAD